MSREWYLLQVPIRLDKNIFIGGPNDINIAVDYDDVDHDLILSTVLRMVEILNEEWMKGE